MNNIIGNAIKISAIILVLAHVDVLSCTAYGGCPVIKITTQKLNNNDLITIRDYACSPGKTYSVADTSYYSVEYNSIKKYFDNYDFYLIKPIATYVPKDASNYDTWVGMYEDYMQYPGNVDMVLQIGVGNSKNDLCNDMSSYKYALYCNSLLKSDTVNLLDSDESYITSFENEMKRLYGEVEYYLPYVLYSEILISSKDISYSKHAFIDSMLNFAVCPAGQNQYYNSQYWIVFFDGSIGNPTNLDMKHKRFPISLIDGSFYLERNGISFNLNQFNGKFPLNIQSDSFNKIKSRNTREQFKYDLLGRTWLSRQ